MTDNEKITLVQAFFDDAPSTALCTVALKKAHYAVMQQRFSLVGWTEETEFPAQFDMEQVELAARFISRMGGLGEVSHNENGINRTWASEDDTDILKRIPPFIKVVANESVSD